MSDGFRPVSRSSRTRSVSRFGRQQQERRADEFHEEVQKLGDAAAPSLNLRVKERGPTNEERPKSRLSSIFRGESSGPTSVVSTHALEQKANELKDTLTRPLSSLFRRSHSHDRSAPVATANAQLAAGQLPPPAARPIPSARGPIANQQSAGSGGFGQSSAASGSRMPMTNIANGGTSNLAVTTTATRPFSGFPGRKQTIQQTQMSEEPTTTVGASVTSHFETDLSEQAAIAPHVNIRRFSGIHVAEQFFGRGNQQNVTGGGGRSAREGAGKGGGTGDIDVNFLSRFLCPEDEIQDDQIPWTWDSLFTSVSSELREEWALEEEANNDLGELGVGLGMPNGLQQHATSIKDFD